MHTQFLAKSMEIHAYTQGQKFCQETPGLGIAGLVLLEYYIVN